MSERLPIGSTYPLRLATGRLFFRQREVAFIIDHYDGEIVLHGGIEPGLLRAAIAIADATVLNGDIPDFAFETAKPACWDHTPAGIDAAGNSPPPYVTDEPAPAPKPEFPEPYISVGGYLQCPHCPKRYKKRGWCARKHLHIAHGYTVKDSQYAIGMACEP